MSFRFIQQSQDKKSLLTYVHCRQKREEGEEHKIKGRTFIKKTIVTIEFEEQKMNCCDS